MVQKRRVRLCGCLMVAVLAAAALGCNETVGGDSAKDSSKVSQSVDPVQYVKVEQQSIPDTLDLAAKVQADPTKIVHIFPPASGRLISIAVKPGDYVQRGETIAVL